MLEDATQVIYVPFCSHKNVVSIDAIISILMICAISTVFPEPNTTVRDIVNYLFSV